jgi:hypothetical protein
LKQTLTNFSSHDSLPLHQRTENGLEWNWNTGWGESEEGRRNKMDFILNDVVSLEYPKRDGEDSGNILRVVLDLLKEFSKDFINESFAIIWIIAIRKIRSV